MLYGTTVMNPFDARIRQRAASERASRHAEARDNAELFARLQIMANVMHEMQLRCFAEAFNLANFLNLHAPGHSAYIDAGTFVGSAGSTVNNSLAQDILEIAHLRKPRTPRLFRTDTFRLIPLETTYSGECVALARNNAVASDKGFSQSNRLPLGLRDNGAVLVYDPEMRWNYRSVTEQSGGIVACTGGLAAEQIVRWVIPDRNDGELYVDVLGQKHIRYDAGSTADQQPAVQYWVDILTSAGAAALARP